MPACKTALRRGNPETWIRLWWGFLHSAHSAPVLSALSTAAVYVGSRELDRYTPCIGSESERLKSPSKPHSLILRPQSKKFWVSENAAAAFQALWHSRVSNCTFVLVSKHFCTSKDTCRRPARHTRRHSRAQAQWFRPPRAGATCLYSPKETGLAE